MPIGMNHNTFSVNPSEDSVIEIGAIYGSARSNVPTGYLLCDGSAISRTIYDRLFTAIGTSYGVGDSSTTFNLPDLRGAVPRGAGTSSGYSTNVTTNLGSKQDDAIQDHSHSALPDAIGVIAGPINWNYVGGFGNISSPGTYGMNSGRTSSETRMKNQGVNFFIKF